MERNARLHPNLLSDYPVSSSVRHYKFLVTSLKCHRERQRFMVLSKALMTLFILKNTLPNWISFMKVVLSILIT
jgi:hypothetical protein